MKKILISADCNGNFQFLIKKVTSLMQKTEFDFMLCVGNVLSISETDAIYQMRAGKIKLPLPTFFIEAGEMAKTLNHLFPNGKEILPNFTYLGKSGIKQIKGVKIAFLSGIQNDKYNNFYSIEEKFTYTSNYFTQNDINILSKSDEYIDILLTNQWPDELNNQQIKNKSRYISIITNHLSPRYHFAGMEGKYHKRNQYLNKKGYGTSFVAVGGIKKGQQNKQKYLHAIQIVPFYQLNNKVEVKSSLENNPFQTLNNQNIKKEINPNRMKDFIKPVSIKTTIEGNISPLIYFEKFSDQTHESQIQQFIERWGKIKKLQIFFDQRERRHKGIGIVIFQDLAVAKKCLEQSGKYSLHGSRIKFSIKNQNNKYTDDKCWFCRESQVFDQSLVFHYGKYCYLALDKGPITSDHFLIIPYKHTGSSFNLEFQIKSQIYQLKEKLRLYFLKQNKFTIFYQRYLNLSNSVNHNILHCIPIKIDNFIDISNKFQKKCYTQKLSFYKVSLNELQSQIGKSFYYIIEFDEINYLKIIKQKHFPIDFGRTTICQLINLTERINWKSCVNQQLSSNQIRAFRNILKQCNIIQ